MADSKLLFTRIAQRIDTEANWQAADPVLLKGELAITYVAGGKAKFKVGDNVSKWSELPYSYDYNEILTQISGLETTINNTIEGLGGNVHVKNSYAELQLVSNPKKGDIGVVKTRIEQPDNEDGTYDAGTPEHYSYTGYAWDSANNAWVAFSDKYDAESVYFSKDITITKTAGYQTVSGDNKVLDTKGKNVKQLFEMLYAQEDTSSALRATAPKLHIDGTRQYYELGSEITPVCNTTFTAGAYKYTPTATGITASNYLVKNVLTGEEREVADATFGTYKFTTVTDMKFTAQCDYTQGNIPNSNLGNPVSAQRFPAKTGATADNNQVILYSSYKPNFYGFITNAANKLTTLDSTTLTNAFIRGLTNQSTNNNPVTDAKTAPLTSVTPSAKWIQFFYAVPTGRKSGLSATDDKTKLPCAKATKHENITITHQNGVTSTYTVFVISNDDLADANKINLTWT